MSTPSRTQIAPPVHVAIVDGSAGIRMCIALNVKQLFPHATIEDIDPFSQTMRGAGFALGSRGDAIVLGGVGTEREAHDALKRLCSSTEVPPIIMLVAQSLMKNRDAFIAAGAFDVLRKDALSGRRLHHALQRAIATNQDIVVQPLHVPAPEYGSFAFDEAGKRGGVEIDGFRYLSNLASGKMAKVFLAESIENGTNAVIKLLYATPLHQTRGISELCEISRRLRPLRGSAVVDELDAGIAAAYPYVALEFLAHGDLRGRMLGAPSIAVALQTMRSLMHALDDLHAQGVCHADLKPESIFFRADDSVVLIDFNISCLFGRAAKNSELGDALGTPAYMSPEQGAGGALDARSDLYSVGILFFEMLCGTPPFTADSATQTIFRHLHEEIPLLPRRFRHLQSVVDQLLAKSPDERYQTAAEVIKALSSIDENVDPSGGS